MHPSISPEQLQQLLAEHGAALVLFAAQWTDAPDDCVQEALLDLVRLPTAPANPVAWLFHVVRKRAYSMYRSAQRRRKHETAVGAAAAAWFLPAPAPEIDSQALAAALQELDLEYREVIVARIWGGLSFEQIGTLVGASTSAAHRRYEAGLRMLRKCLMTCRAGSEDVP
jgi:RNA polymerase sigma-70 factor (ECF subfamily)